MVFLFFICMFVGVLVGFFVGLCIVDFCMGGYDCFIYFKFTYLLLTSVYQPQSSLQFGMRI